ncbi:MAG TPA: YidC/Oxa1 family membrane protein insertase [Acidimicrobiales bacterium]|nr:YidC/Oxa1 family membrane protein insertase [Acidimicrobiales bacterium]
MFDLLAGALAFFYDVWDSYGMAIVLFTIAIYLVLTPLTIKSTRSMIAMQRVQPELKKLQAQYKDDKETLQREMMAFYQANNINPLSSCLPLLLQMPIFFVLFQVLNGLTRKETVDGITTFAPKYLDHSSALFRDLDATDRMISWGIDLSRSAGNVLSGDGAVDALPYLVLVGLTALLSWYQQKQVQGRNVNQAQVNPQQQMMMRVLPFIFIPISYSLPAGVVVYFVVSSLVRVGQQAVVTRMEFPELRRGGGSPNGSKPPKPSKPAPAATVVQDKQDKPDKPKDQKPVPPSPRVAQGQQRSRSKNRKRKRK